jgi:hypothetical protein
MIGPAAWGGSLSADALIRNAGNLDRLAWAALPPAADPSSPGFPPERSGAGLPTLRNERKLVTKQRPVLLTRGFP